MRQLNSIVRGYKQFYAGVIPYLLLNHFVSYSLVSLYSPAKQERTLSAIRVAHDKEFSYAENK